MTRALTARVVEVVKIRGSLFSRSIDYTVTKIPIWVHPMKYTPIETNAKDNI